MWATHVLDKCLLSKRQLNYRNTAQFKNAQWTSMDISNEREINKSIQGIHHHWSLENLYQDHTGISLHEDESYLFDHDIGTLNIKHSS